MENEEENAQSGQTIVVGNVSLQLAQDGKSAIASCFLLGVFKVEFVIPESEVKAFDEQRIAQNKNKILLLSKKGLHA